MGLFKSLLSRRKPAEGPLNGHVRPSLEPLEARVLLSVNPLAAIPPGNPGELTIYRDTDSWYLLEALLATAPGMVVQNVVLRSHIDASGAVSSGIYVNDAGTYGLGDYGIVLSSGDVGDYEDGANLSTGNTTSYGVPATTAQETLLDTVTGGWWDHWDVTELQITFDLLPGYDTISFMVVFGSEEYPEYVGSSWIDGFGLFVNGINIATVGADPVNINHPDMSAVVGTELDGVLAPGGDPVLVFETQLVEASTGNTLTFIISDTSDSILDSTVYFSGLTANPLPSVDDLSITTTQDTPVGDQVTGSDPQRDPLTFSVLTDPADGGVVMNADGTFTYTPDLGFFGTDTFTFIANDGENDSLPGTVTIFVNDPPTAQNLPWSTGEDTQGTGQAVGTDVQGQDLTYMRDSSPTNGTLLFNSDGSFVYTPLPDFNGTDSFTFHVNDGYADSNVATVTVTVDPVNDAPSADDQSVITGEGGLIVIDLTGSDLETAVGDLVYTITQDPANGSYVQLGNQITYTADIGYTGLDSFKFTVTDTGDPAGGDQGWGFAAALESAEATVDIGVPEKQDFSLDGTASLDLGDGRTVNLSVRGNGTGEIYHFVGIDYSTPLDIARIVLTGTDDRTVLSVRTRGEVTLGDIVVSNASLGTINAKTTDLIGDVEILNGSLSRMTMRNISDGTLSIGAVPPRGTLTLSVQQVSDFSISSAAPIRTLNAIEWLDDDGIPDSITAPWIGALITRGSRGNSRRGITASAGDFCSDLTLSGAGLPPRGITLGRASIKGSISEATWQITGPTASIVARGGMQDTTVELDHPPSSNVPALRSLSTGIMDNTYFTSTGDLGNMLIGGMVDSNLFAGVTNWIPGDGLPDPDTQIELPVSMGGTGNNAFMRRVNIRGSRNSGYYTTNFSNSNIAGYDLGIVTLRNAKLTTTGTDFGVAAWQVRRISYTDRNRARNWVWPRRGRQVLTSDSDMKVRLGMTGVESFLPGECVLRDRAGDAGFAYADITGVSLRAMSDWAYIAIATANPLQNTFSQDVSVRIKLDTNVDSLSVLDEDDGRSDYYVDWILSTDEITVWTGGGYWDPTSWSEISAPTAYSMLTNGGLLIAVPLDAFDNPHPLDPQLPDRVYEYVKLVEVSIWKSAGVADTAS